MVSGSSSMLPLQIQRRFVAMSAAEAGLPGKEQSGVYPMRAAQHQQLTDHEPRGSRPPACECPALFSERDQADPP
jgi:hypothetical protein